MHDGRERAGHICALRADILSAATQWRQAQYTVVIVLYSYRAMRVLRRIVDI